jgi:hypothetical protein
VLLKRNIFTPLVAGLFLFTALSAAVEIAPSNLLIPSALKGVQLLHDDRGFVVVKDGDAFPVRPEYTDKELRNLSDEDLDFVLGLKTRVRINGEDVILTRIDSGAAQELLIVDNADSVQLSDKESRKIVSQLPVSSYIKVLQYEDGEFGLRLRTRLQGGGFFGGWLGAVVCKFVVSGVLHGAILVVSAATGPAAPAVFAALEATAGASIEAASTAAALAGGITGAVITGPV